MTSVLELPGSPTAAPARRIDAVWAKLAAEIAKFGTIGAVAFVIDVGVFNLLRAEHLSDSPLTAKTVSVVLATAFAFFANRHWTYRDRARTGTGRESALFFAANGVALLISWACLWFTHYALGLDSQLADNLSGNVLALGLGTMFRFWAYRTWVFPEHAPGAGDPAVDELTAEAEALAAAEPIGDLALVGPLPSVPEPATDDAA